MSVFVIVSITNGRVSRYEDISFEMAVGEYFRRYDASGGSRISGPAGTPPGVSEAHWSLTSLRKTLVKIAAKIASHGRYVTFQMAEVAVPRDLFRGFLQLIDRLRPWPAPA